MACLKQKIISKWSVDIFMYVDGMQQTFRLIRTFQTSSSSSASDTKKCILPLASYVSNNLPERRRNVGRLNEFLS